jgi:hypothetical protein
VTPHEDQGQGQCGLWGNRSVALSLQPRSNAACALARDARIKDKQNPSATIQKLPTREFPQPMPMWPQHSDSQEAPPCVACTVAIGPGIGDILPGLGNLKPPAVATSLETGLPLRAEPGWVPTARGAGGGKVSVLGAEASWMKRGRWTREAAWEQLVRVPDAAMPEAVAKLFCFSVTGVLWFGYGLSVPSQGSDKHTQTSLIAHKPTCRTCV